MILNKILNHLRFVTGLDLSTDAKKGHHKSGDTLPLSCTQIYPLLLQCSYHMIWSLLALLAMSLSITALPQELGAVLLQYVGSVNTQPLRDMRNIFRILNILVWIRILHVTRCLSTTISIFVSYFLSVVVSFIWSCCCFYFLMSTSPRLLTSVGR